MKEPRVTAIIIFWNAEKYVREAIESVFAQTFCDWELLLVDDGSTDASTEIARHFAELRPARVRYFEHASHQHRGTGPTRNLGIHHARGENIAFLDADDVWLPQALEEQITMLYAHPTTGMVYGPLQKWFSWMGKAEPRDTVYPLGVPSNTLIPPPRLLQLSLERRAAVPSPAVLVRREVAEEVGGFEESFTGLYEDQAFCAKVYLTAPVVATRGYWYRYRQHAHSTCATAERTGQFYAARGKYLNWLADYFSEQGVVDRELWRALRQEQRWYRGRAAVRLFRRYPKIFRMMRRVEDRVLRVERRVMPMGEEFER